MQHNIPGPNKPAEKDRLGPPGKCLPQARYVLPPPWTPPWLQTRSQEPAPTPPRLSDHLMGTTQGSPTSQGRRLLSSCPPSADTSLRRCPIDATRNLCSPTGSRGGSFLLLPASGGPGLWPRHPSLCSVSTRLLLCVSLLTRIPVSGCRAHPKSKIIPSQDLYLNYTCKDPIAK